MGKAESGFLRVASYRRLMLEFHGTKVTADVGLLAFRELDNILGVTEIAGQILADSRTGKNNRQTLTARFRQSVAPPDRRGGYAAAHALPCRSTFQAGQD